MKTTAIIERGNDGSFGIYAPDLENVIIGEGKTVAEAKADFENSLTEILECYKDNCPAELRDIEFEYKYDVASVFNYFDFINVTKFAKWAKINPTLLRQYKSCPGIYMSESRAKEIETAFHRIGEEFTAISL